MKARAGALKSGRLRDLTLTAGRRHDGKVGGGMLKKYRRGQVGAVIADAGYDAAGVRRQVRRMRAKRCVKPTKSRKNGRRCHKALYRERNKVERLFRRLKRCRRVATRYDKTAAGFEGFVRLPVRPADPVGRQIVRSSAKRSAWPGGGLGFPASRSRPPERP